MMRNLRLEPGPEHHDHPQAASRYQGGNSRTQKRFPAPEHLRQRWDVWIKIRISPTEVGWLLGSVLDYEAPSGIGGFMEGSNYSAIKVLNTVQDPDVGPIIWYVVGERRPRSPPRTSLSMEFEYLPGT